MKQINKKTFLNRKTMSKQKGFFLSLPIQNCADGNAVDFKQKC